MNWHVRFEPTIKLINQMAEVERELVYWKEEYRKMRNQTGSLRRELHRLKADRGLVLTGAAKNRIMKAVDEAIAREFVE